jgi:hypothetical protein
MRRSIFSERKYVVFASTVSDCPCRYLIPTGGGAMRKVANGISFTLNRD